MEFSSLEWSPDEKKVLYVAEKKPQKSEPFYKRKAPLSNDGGSGDEEKTKVSFQFISIFHNSV